MDSWLTSNSWFSSYLLDLSWLKHRIPDGQKVQQIKTRTVQSIISWPNQSIRSNDWTSHIGAVASIEYHLTADFAMNAISPMNLSIGFETAVVLWTVSFVGNPELLSLGTWYWYLYRAINQRTDLLDMAISLRSHFFCSSSPKDIELLFL